MSKLLNKYTKQDPESGDSSLGVTSEDETRLFNLGTAASKDVTTSATDDTSGRVLRIDDYLDRAGESDDAMTEVTDLDNGWTGEVRYILRAGWVMVNIQELDPSSATSISLLTLPSKYHPEFSRIQSVVRKGNNDTTVFRLEVSSGGNIFVEDAGSDKLNGSISYPVLP